MLGMRDRNQSENLRAKSTYEFLRGEDLQSLLEALDLRLPLGNALSVGHDLGLALRLELVQVREHRIKLLAGRGEVLLVVQEGRLLRLHLGFLALHLLHVRRLRELILLRELVVRGLRGTLRRLRLRQEGSEVRLRNLKHAHDGVGDVRLGAAELRRLLLLEDGDRVRHRLRRVLVVLRSLLELFVFLRADRGRFGLVGVHLRHLRLKSLDLLLQLGNRRRRLLDSDTILVGLGRELGLLGLALRGLLVAEGLGVRLLRGLLLEARDHVLDEALDLAERSIASFRTQLSEEVAAILDLLQDRRHAFTLLVVVIVDLRLRGDLEEDLHAGLEHLLRLGDGRELARRVLLARRPLLGLHAAAHLELLEVLLVVRERLLRGREALLRARLGVLQAGLLRRGRGHALLHRGDLRLQALLEHLVGVLRLHLRRAGIAQRRLGLLLHVGEGVHNATPVRLVARSRRLGLELQILVAIRRGRLEQGLNDRLVLLVHPVGLDHLRENRGQLLQLVLVPRLQEALATLQHNQRALEPVNGVHHLLLGALESCLLFIAELRRIGKLRLGRRDLAGELLDLSAELADAGRGIGDLRVEVPDRALVRSDGILLLIRFRVAPLRVFLHHHLLRRKVALYLARELVQQFDDFRDRADLGRARSDEEEKRQACHGVRTSCSSFQLRQAQTLE